MASARPNSAWEDFLNNPPDLEGGLALEVRREDDRRAVLRVSYDGGAVELRAAWLAVPYPSGLRRFLVANPEVECAVVDRIPRGLDAAAQELGVSYLDRRGRGRLMGPGFAYVVPPASSSPPVHREDELDGGSQLRLPEAPRSPGVGKRSAFPFAPKASRLVRALLVDPGSRHRLSDLAGEVEVDPGNAHRVLSALVEAGYVERDDDRYVVSDPGSLLEAWAEQSRRKRDRLVVPVEHDLAEFVASLLQRGGPDTFVSGEFAAELLAPHLSAGSAVVHCVASSAWEAIGAEIQNLVPPVRRSARVDVFQSDPGVGQFGSSRDGLRLVAPQQIYVDLWGEMGRGRQAAEHLRREVLGY